MHLVLRRTVAKKALAQPAHTLKLRFQPPPLASAILLLPDQHVYDLDYSLYRESEAWHFISRHNAAIDLPDYTRGALGGTPSVCVAMVTVRRELDTYFEASVGSLLEGLTERERRALYLSVLFADTDPAVHPSSRQKWAGRLVDEAGSYNVSTGQLEHLRMLERQRNFHEKGVFYTIVFEDDIILATGWFVKMLKYDADAAYRNMPFIFTILTASTFCFLLLIRRSPRFQLLHLDILSILMDKPGCCTQGSLFPAQQADGLIAFLEARGRGQTDPIIEEDADLNGLHRYAVAPPLLQHVGLKSSRDNLDVNTQGTWAF
ncbi:hypothetical protein BDW68DRAFT_195196 [Aspergillus falconensis]